MEQVHQQSAAVSMRRWSWVLLGLAGLGIVLIVLTLLGAAFGPEVMVALVTTSGLRAFDQNDLVGWHRFVVVFIAGAEDLCWIYCLWQIVLLARCFSRGEVLTLRVVRFFRRFGYGLFAVGIVESCSVPLLAAYLRSIHKLDEPLKQFWEHVFTQGLLSIMSSVLIVVTARILILGIRLREDKELTI